MPMPEHERDAALKDIIDKINAIKGELHAQQKVLDEEGPKKRNANKDRLNQARETLVKLQNRLKHETNQFSQHTLDFDDEIRGTSAQASYDGVKASLYFDTATKEKLSAHIDSMIDAVDALLAKVGGEMTEDLAQQMIENIKADDNATPEKLLLVYLYEQYKELKARVGAGLPQGKYGKVDVEEDGEDDTPEVKIDYKGVPFGSRFDVVQSFRLNKEVRAALGVSLGELREMLAADALPSSERQKQKRRKAIYPLLVVAKGIRNDEKDGPHPAVEAIPLPDDITPDEQEAADELKELLQKDKSAKKVKTFILFVLQQCANHRLYNLPEFSQAGGKAGGDDERAPDTDGADDGGGDEETTSPAPESNEARNKAELKALYEAQYAAIMAKPEADRATMVRGLGSVLVSAAISDFEQVVDGKVKDLLSDKDADKKLRKERMTALILAAEDNAFVLLNNIDQSDVRDARALIDKIKQRKIARKVR